MKANEIRKKYIEFFKSSPRNHKEIPPAPLVLENDPTTLFTSSGMQPLVPYLMGEPHPEGKRLVNSQPSIRLQDIDEVGDSSHTTFFEMLGNWSLGDYFKKDQLAWFYEFLTKDLGLPREKFWVSVFEGNDQVPKDEESAVTWKSLGIPEEKILYYGVEKNWWSRSGTPADMPVGEIGGSDSEVFFEFTQVRHNLKFGRECHPNCGCGRFLEIGNSVFIQYKKVDTNTLEELPNKNVDFGGGLERITAAMNNDPDIFQIDLFEPIIGVLEKSSRKTYKGNEISMRIIADHLRASSVLLSDGVIPSNKTQGYVLRKLLRRSIMHIMFLGGVIDIAGALIKSVETYSTNNGIKFGRSEKDVIKAEGKKYVNALERGMKIITNTETEKINGRFIFDLYQTEGLPLEFVLDYLTQRVENFSMDKRKRIISEFESYKKEHQDTSRTTSAGVFKGGLADNSPDVIRLHTATHLLLASLRKVLGDHVVQRGQNITKERTRFDFPHPQKLTEEELKKVEDLINDVIAKDLPVSFKVMPKDEALKTGAIHAFNEKYADTVKVYTIGNPTASSGPPFSQEFCGGPHVKNTSEVGRVRIKKQEKIGAGLLRIYAAIS